MSQNAPTEAPRERKPRARTLVITSKIRARYAQLTQIKDPITGRVKSHAESIGIIATEFDFAPYTVEHKYLKDRPAPPQS